MVKQNSTRATPKSPAAAPTRKAPGGGRPAATAAKTVATAPRGEASSATTRAKPAATGRFAGLQRGFRETIAELRKVQWPDRTTTRNLTLVVIGMSAVLSLVLGAFDYVLTLLVEWLIKL